MKEVCENCQNNKALKDPKKQEWSWCKIVEGKVLKSQWCEKFEFKNCKDVREKINELKEQSWKIVKAREGPLTPEERKEIQKINRMIKYQEKKLFNDNPDYLANESDFKNFDEVMAFLKNH